MRNAFAVYFQPARRETVDRSIDGAEGQNADRGHRRRDVRDVALQEMPTDARELLEAAFDRAHLTKDEAARQMGITGTQLNRQLRNLDNQHVSFQRLWKLPNAFWRELLILVAQRKRVARVRPPRVVLDFEGV